MGKTKSKSKAVDISPVRGPIAGEDFELILPRDHLSFSQVTMYMRCPAQYYHRYILDLKEPPSIALLEGSSHHTALEWNGRYKIKTGKDQKAKDVYENFADDFLDHSRGREVQWLGESADGVTRRGKALIDSHMRNHAGKILPLQVEQEIRWQMAGVPMIGFVDCVTKSQVLDYKVKKRVSSQSDVDQDMQLQMYGVVTNRRLGRQYNFVKVKEPYVTYLDTEIDLVRAAWWLTNVVGHVAKAISAGNFPPTNPTEWICDPRYCGFHHRCIGARPQAPASRVVVLTVGESNAKKESRQGKKVRARVSKDPRKNNRIGRVGKNPTRAKANAR